MYELGIKKPSDYKSLGKRSLMIIRVAEGPFKGAYAYRDYSTQENRILLNPLPQVGLKNSIGNFEFFLLGQLPSENMISQFNLTMPGSIKVLGCEAETAQEELIKRGIPHIIVHGEEVAGKSDLDCDFERNIDDIVFRTVSKIAFNYLTYWKGPEFVRDSSFDIIRAYILTGQKPEYQLVYPDEIPILGDEPVNGKRRLGHIVTLTVGWDDDRVSILAKVSLLNMLTYNVSLARNYSGININITRGHFFDTKGHEILTLMKKSL